MPRTAGILLVSLSLGRPTVGAAQDVAALVGVSSYRMNTSGIGTMGAPQLAIAIGHGTSIVFAVPLLVDSKSDGSVDFPGTITTKLLLPEVRLELSRRFGKVAPFIGAGVGVGANLNGPEFGGLSLHATTGARLDVSRRTYLIAGVVARSIRPFNGRTFDVLIGLGFRRPR